MKHVLFILGTRPELIKLNPLIRQYKKSNNHKVLVCITSQHKELLHDLFNFFEFEYDYDLVVMKQNQTLISSFLDILARLNNINFEVSLDLIFVQGDTNTAFAGALYGFYNNIKVAHIEAGLRSGNLLSPYPEEGNRKMISQIATYHLCPTNLAFENLVKENFSTNIYVTGNTVIDSLLLTIKNTESQQTKYQQILKNKGINLALEYILVTMHRRENFGEPLLQICSAILEFAINHPQIQFVLPIHPNRNGKFIKNSLNSISNIILLEPLPYDELIFLMNNCLIVMTDSGGIQEEAISCNKPILILRDTTERQEVVDIGAGVLVYADKLKIINLLEMLCYNKDFRNRMINKINPYGIGDASDKIFSILY